ncbi:hypothetical protein [Streptomyces rubiginosohelvolus]|uniref:hypothetical protein n=1 Tax=Streptomyces rubiginosohelvolus TaxID=67362 RepID=UPI00370FCCD9
MAGTDRSDFDQSGQRIYGSQNNAETVINNYNHSTDARSAAERLRLDRERLKLEKERHALRLRREERFHDFRFWGAIALFLLVAILTRVFTGETLDMFLTEWWHEYWDKFSSQVPL